MIGYVCKYTPVEVFEAMGVEIRRIQPEVTNFNQADTLMKRFHEKLLMRLY